MAIKSNSMEERLAALEQEITNLKLANTVQAPLRVVDSEGNVILHVDATQNGAALSLLASDGSQVASMSASRYGGCVTLYAVPVRVEDVGSFGNQLIELGASTTGANLIIRKAETNSLEMHLSSNAMSFYNAREEAVASFAVNPDDDGGIIVLTDQEGRPGFVQTSEDEPADQQSPKT